MIREDLEEELKEIKNRIKSKIRDKLKSLGLLEEYEQSIKKSDSWGDISSLLKFGTTSPSLMYAPKPKFLIFFIIVAFVSGFITFSGTQSVIPILIFIAAIALISLAIWAIINSNRWFSLKWKYQKQAENELQKTDAEYNVYLEDQNQIEEILRSEREVELAEYRRRKEEERATRNAYENGRPPSAQETEKAKVCVKCNKEHGLLIHLITPWHRCDKCSLYYCDECVSSLPRDFGVGLAGIFLRKCECGGTTKPI